MLRREPEVEVPADGEVRPERQVLKDDGEPALLRWPEDPAVRADDTAVQPDEAAIGRDQAEDDEGPRMATTSAVSIDSETSESMS